MKLNEETLEAAISEAVQKIFNELELVPQDDLNRWIRWHNDVRDERDEARRLAAENGKQIAALRGVLERIEPYLGHESGPKDPKGGRFPTWGQIIRAALTDTAKAAAQYQRVPEGWGVYPREPTEEMTKPSDYLQCIFPRLGMSRAYMAEVYKAMLAAAPTAKPEAGEGESG